LALSALVSLVILVAKVDSFDVGDQHGRRARNEVRILERRVTSSRGFFAAGAST